MSDEIPKTERYSPLWLIDSAREAMGGDIELDPASCQEANAVVGAQRIWTAQENGLLQPWSAERLWLNAPHGRHSTGPWLVRLERVWQNREIGQAVSIWPCMPTSAWFALLWKYPLCFLRHRVRFRAPAGTGRTEGSPREAHVVCYHGRALGRFIKAFAKHGPIAISTVCHD